MGCGISREVSIQPQDGADDNLERKRKIKNNRRSSKLNVADDFHRSRISEEELITLPGAVQQSLPPLRKTNGTVLRNGFNDDLALTASSLLKKNGPINEIRERPRSAEILQELLVQGILNQSHNEDWHEVHTILFDVKSTEGVLKKLPSRLDKLRIETTKQDNVTIEEIENKMMTTDDRRKMKEVKLKERLNKFNSSVLTMDGQSTEMPPVPEHATLEEIVEKITVQQKEFQQELQEGPKGKDRNDQLDGRAEPNQQESKANCEDLELDDRYYLTAPPAEEITVNKS
ncbi:stathmin domain-containing protein 1-like [Leucoraja erinacea]|uniref:stathmin domain-containing protein 1-like n=1 Tax=Leucoraja erinaceus TaxID=7782 RepID=UPI0024561B39|nr:stathmin domain-containing protein 1-like [Leucoraja erinacea]